MNKTLRLLLVSSLTLFQLASLSNITSVEAQATEEQPTAEEIPELVEENTAPEQISVNVYVWANRLAIDGDGEQLPGAWFVGSYTWSGDRAELVPVGIEFDPSSVPLAENRDGYDYYSHHTPPEKVVAEYDGQIIIYEYSVFLNKDNDPEPQPIVVTPVAPSQDGNLVTVPVVESVVYSTESFELTAENPTITVTATVAEGFVLADGSVTEWTFNYVAPEPEPELIPVTPKEPVREDNHITFPDSEGIVYEVVGQDYLHKPGDSFWFETGNIIVNAIPLEGYKIAEGATSSWSYTAKESEPETRKYQFDVYGKTLNSNRVELLPPELLGTFYIEGAVGEVVTIEFPIKSDEWSDPEPLTFTIGDNMPSIIEVERILINTEDEINGVKEAINKAKEVLAKGGWTTESASTLEETISKGERSLKFISEGGYILTDTLGNFVDQLTANINNLVKDSNSSESSGESESSDESTPEESSDETSESESTSSDESSSDKDSDESKTDNNSESTSTDKKQANESEKAKLPETGESSSVYVVITALVLGLIGILVLQLKPKSKH